MLKLLHKYRWWLFGGLCIAFVIWIVLGSPSFQSCIDETQKSGATDKFQKIVSDLLIYRRCIGPFLSANENGIIAFSTFIIAVFTTILGIFTVSLSRSTRIAAEAADLSTKAAIALELPLIRAEPVGFGFGDSKTGDGPIIENFGLQCFEFKNLGRTKAFPIELRWGWSVGDRLPRVPSYELQKPFDLKTIINAEDGCIILYVREFDMQLSSGDIQKITSRPNQTNLWLYCLLTYEDFMYTRHEIGFCWKRYETFGAGGFIPDAAPSYNKRT